mmetsp:Transcript_3278/g.4621  ORF Transcript_3278/g.4621 Transcript_3278/m.4621 type:complete len:83 (-) Transcript_3278:821-1069(-)
MGNKSWGLKNQALHRQSAIIKSGISSHSIFHEISKARSFERCLLFMTTIPKAMNQTFMQTQIPKRVQSIKSSNKELSNQKAI